MVGTARIAPHQGVCELQGADSPSPTLPNKAGPKCSAGRSWAAGGLVGLLTPVCASANWFWGWKWNQMAGSAVTKNRRRGWRLCDSVQCSLWTFRVALIYVCVFYILYPYTTEEADYLIINPSPGMYQEIHPCWSIGIDSLKINPSLELMTCIYILD